MGFKRVFGLEKRQRVPVRTSIVDVNNPVAFCAIIGGRHGYKGHGKCSSEYLPAFQEALQEQRISSAQYRDVESFCSEKQGPLPTIVILIYSEERSKYWLGGAERLFSFLESKLHHMTSSVLIVNAPSIGRIVGDKAATNRHFSSHGVPMPRLATDTAEFTVFSNQLSGSKKPVDVLSPGSRLKSRRYNSAFIDTRQLVDGREYHVSLRAFAVGRELIGTVVRCRCASDGNPSVHSRETPLDPRLIGELQNRTIEANLDALRSICRRVADSAGTAFYAHDILPCRETGKLFLSETNLKFDDRVYREHLRPIRQQIPHIAFLYDGVFERLQASALAVEAKRLGFIS